MAVAGTTAEIKLPFIVGATDVVLRPLTKTTEKVIGSAPLTLKVKGIPSEAGMLWVAVRVGNAITGRAELLLGQVLMKAAAAV